MLQDPHGGSGTLESLIEHEKARQTKIVSRYDDSFGPLTMVQTNERFMRAALPLFELERAAEVFLLWQRPVLNVVALLAWTLLCWSFWLLPALLPLVGVVVLQACVRRVDAGRQARGGSPPRVPRDPAPVPFSQRPFPMAERRRAMRRMQNFMKRFSDIADAVHAGWASARGAAARLLRNRAALRRGQLLCTVLAPLGVLAASREWVGPAERLARIALVRLPMRETACVAGCAVLLAGNPYCRALAQKLAAELSLLGLEGVRSPKDAAAVGGRQGAGESRSRDAGFRGSVPSGRRRVSSKVTGGLIGAERGQYACVFERERWWVGLGWRGERWTPLPRADVQPPPGFEWDDSPENGGWHVDGGWRYSSGPPWSKEFHAQHRAGDFVRRRRWRRLQIPCKKKE
jgi:hypothetical protein